MTITEIRKQAAELGLKVKSRSKAVLIRAIQEAEGNPPCFRTGRITCEQTQCCWLEDCVPEEYARLHRVTGIGARTGKWRR
ncbi:MAG TPA: SAP domain-containing protein [Planctomycetota bacterium]|nr:SAP domain-containing protein [Planctomycetota bacterium]